MGGKIKVTVVMDKDDDAEVIAWLGKQRNMSAAILERLKVSIVPQEQGLDLAAIRRVVDAALDAKLASVAVAPNGDAPSGENPELAARLDSMF